MAGGGIKINNISVSGGADGATFTPSVSEDGVLSWTNNKGYSNPPDVNIKGEKGDKGDKGENGDSVIADAVLDAESTNAVQNKVITEKLNDKMPYFTEWNAETTYKKGDIVYRKYTRNWWMGGQICYTYAVSIADNNIGHEPVWLGDPAAGNDAYWNLAMAPLSHLPQYNGAKLSYVYGIGGGTGTAKYYGARRTNDTETDLDRVIMTTDDYGNTFIGLNPTHDKHATPKKFVEDLVATKTLYLHEYTLIGTVANENGSYVYVKVLTNQDTAYTSVTDLWAEYEKIVSVRFAYVSNTIVVPEQIGFDYINIRYVNGSGVFDETVDITTLSIYSQTITQLN